MIPQHPWLPLRLFPMGGVKGIPIANMAQEDVGVRTPTPTMERVLALLKPRPGPLLGFDCHDFVHLAFHFGQVQVSRPQVFSSVLSIPSPWICSPLYLLVAYVWDIVGLILFLGVYIILYIWGFILCCS